MRAGAIFATFVLASAAPADSLIPLFVLPVTAIRDALPEGACGDWH